MDSPFTVGIVETRTSIAPALVVPLGLDAGRVVLESFRGIAERFGAKGLFSSLSPSFQKGLPMFEDDIKAWLGFDPLRLLARLARRAPHPMRRHRFRQGSAMRSQDTASRLPAQRRLLSTPRCPCSAVCRGAFPW